MKISTFLNGAILVCLSLLVSVNGFRIPAPTSIHVEQLTAQSLYQRRSILKTRSYAATAVLEVPEASAPLIDVSGMKFSSLQGKALKERNIPSLSEVKAALPKSVWEKSNVKSLSFAIFDIIVAAIPISIAVKYLLPTIASPTIASILGWVLYAVVAGTTSLGMWVTAHECGHGAFSNSKRLSDFVGFLFHSILLVPYFSWQRSHQVHHANTNHIEDGETHVPPILNTSEASNKAICQKVFGRWLGNKVYASAQLFAHLVLGWPAYLMLGVTGIFQFRIVYFIFSQYFF